jgi:hypothetical protein
LKGNCLLPESEAYNKDTSDDLQPVLSLFNALISFVLYLLFFCSLMTRNSHDLSRFLKSNLNNLAICSYFAQICKMAISKVAL